jgi:uncharacterized protein (TIGR03083 family)
VEIKGYIDALGREGSLLADAAEEAGLTADVPTCPGWQVRDLVRHQAYVHGWAARHVREQAAEVIDGPAEAEILVGGPPDGELIAAYRTGHAALLHTLCEADPAVRCATFMPASSPLAFWARRQAHETAIHRFDAQSASPEHHPDPARAFAPSFAEDGLDELITGFAPRRRYRSRAHGERSLAVRAADTGGCWLIRFANGATTVSRGEADADCTLDGTASGLYAFLWNRCGSAHARVAVTGDASVIDTWRSSVRVIFD